MKELSTQATAPARTASRTTPTVPMRCASDFRVGRSRSCATAGATASSAGAGAGPAGGAAGLLKVPGRGRLAAAAADGLRGGSGLAGRAAGGRGASGLAAGTWSVAFGPATRGAFRRGTERLLSADPDGSASG